jgi:hypothetical protein
MSFREAIDSKDCKDLAEHLSYRLIEISSGIKNSTIKFRDPMELLNFLIVELLTNWYHGLPEDIYKRERFVDNIKQIVKLLEELKND